MCLTFRKGFNSRIGNVKRLQVGQMSEAFGHQISKIRTNKYVVRTHSLEATGDSFACRSRHRGGAR